MVVAGKRERTRAENVGSSPCISQPPDYGKQKDPEGRRSYMIGDGDVDSDDSDDDDDSCFVISHQPLGLCWPTMDVTTEVEEGGRV